MNSSEFIDVPCRVPRSKFVIDWFGIIFVCGLLVGLAVCVTRDHSNGPVDYLLLLFALFPVWIAVRPLRSHLRVGQIVVREQGLEIVRRGKKILIRWEDVEEVREKPFYDGGLVFVTEKNKGAFIPPGVTIPYGITNYKAIRSFVAKKVPRRSGPNQPATSS